MLLNTQNFLFYYYYFFTIFYHYLCHLFPLNSFTQIMLGPNFVVRTIQTTAHEEQLQDLGSTAELYKLHRAADICVCMRLYIVCTQQGSFSPAEDFTVYERSRFTHLLSSLLLLYIYKHIYTYIQ